MEEAVKIETKSKLHPLWVVFLFTLPFDSVVLPSIFNQRPLFYVLLLLLAAVIALGLLVKKKMIAVEKADKWYLLFVAFVVLDGALQLFLLPKGANYKGLLPAIPFDSAVIMLLAYYVPRFEMDSVERSIKTIKWTLIAFIPAMLWGLLQAFYALRKANWNGTFFRALENHIIFRGGLISNRISMFSMEPAWAAALLLLFVIPFLVVALHYKFSFFRRFNFYYGKISLDIILAGLALFCLVMTLSVSGIFSFVFFVFFFWWIFRRSKIFYKNVFKILPIIVILVAVAVPYIGASLGRLSGIDQIFSNNISAIFSGDLSNSFGVRGASWIVGFEEFAKDPLFGVGLKNTMFYYMDLVPAWARDYDEVKGLLDPSAQSYIPSPKGLIPGLLGETGLIGFLLFAVFFAKLIYSLNSIQSTDKGVLVLKNGFILALLTLLPLGALGFDVTYIYFWLFFGMAAAFAAAMRREFKQEF